MSAFSNFAANAFEWVFDHLVVSLLTLFIIGIIGFIPFAVYMAYQQSKSPSFTLYKNQWSCTNMQRVPTTTYVVSGNVAIPMTTYHDECHQWSRQP